MRLRPSSHFATGSCATTITSVFARKQSPIPRSLTCAMFFANAGKMSPSSEKPTRDQRRVQHDVGDERLVPQHERGSRRGPRRPVARDARRRRHERRARRGSRRTSARRSRTAAGTCSGCDVVAINPPTTPPTPMPRLFSTRCIAYALCRSRARSSAATIVAWLGQNEPLPSPARIAATNAGRAVWTSAKPPKPSGRDDHRRRRARRAGRRGRSARRTPGPPTSPATERGGEDEARRAERDPAHVVQVDEEEREDDAVPERVREAAGEERPELPREVRVERTEVRAHRPRVSRAMEAGGRRCARAEPQAASYVRRSRRAPWSSARDTFGCGLIARQQHHRRAGTRQASALSNWSAASQQKRAWHPCASAPQVEPEPPCVTTAAAVRQDLALGHVLLDTSRCPARSRARTARRCGRLSAARRSRRSRGTPSMPSKTLGLVEHGSERDVDERTVGALRARVPRSAGTQSLHTCRGTAGARPAGYGGQMSTYARAVEARPFVRRRGRARARAARRPPPRAATARAGIVAAEPVVHRRDPEPRRRRSARRGRRTRGRRASGCHARIDGAEVVELRRRVDLAETRSRR